MHHRPAAGNRLQVEFQALVSFAHEEFLEQEGLLAHLRHGRPERQAVELVTQGQQAGRLQPDDRRARRQRRGNGRHHPLRFAASSIDHALRQVGSPAAQGTFRFGVIGRRAQHLHGITTGREHSNRCFGDFRRVVMREGIDKKQHFFRLTAAFRRRVGESLRNSRHEAQGVHFRNGPLCRYAPAPFNQPGQPGPGIAQADQRLQGAPIAMQPFGQAAEQFRPGRQPKHLVALREIFGLDQRHVDRARTLFLAALAGNAQIHRCRQVGMRERMLARPLPQFAIERRLESLDPRPGRMCRVVRDAVARAHHALALALALVVVHAHGNRLGVIAPGCRNTGVSVADAVGVVGRPVEMGFHARTQARAAPVEKCLFSVGCKSDSRQLSNNGIPKTMCS